ncbi:MAG: hypothetical protein CMP91_11155 [Gammaproteobacteria bacterium]|nr:hypothetical protein [Gammaproteobacteria bacterium]MAY03349.1 hypothetical protein [Gammaproteobacteria bacterium]
MSACSIFVPGGPWPSDLPPRQYFVDYYQASPDNHEYQEQDEYLNWVRVFYQGNALSPGWHLLTEELLFESEAARHEEYSLKMANLGRQISAEWAKGNEVRLIDTRCASIWRDALIEAIERDDLDNYIARFENDVNAILGRELDKEEISRERYYEVEEFDFL